MKMEATIKTTKHDETEYLIRTVALLSDFVGHLFSLKFTAENSEQVAALEAVDNLYLFNVAEPIKPTPATLENFGHRLAVHFTETCDAQVVSKYSEPVFNPRYKGADTIMERAVVSRIKHVNSSFYGHATGYVWDTHVRVSIRKKSLIYLDKLIGKETFDRMELFDKYTIFDAFPNTFEANPSMVSFPHSISLTCETQAVIYMKLNSPCKRLEGSTVDYATQR